MEIINFSTTVKPTAVLTKASVWYEIGVLLLCHSFGHLSPKRYESDLSNEVPYVSVQMVVEFHGVAGDIRYNSIIQWTNSKNFLISWAIIWLRASEVGKYGIFYYVNFWAKEWIKDWFLT